MSPPPSPVVARGGGWVQGGDEGGLGLAAEDDVSPPPSPLAKPGAAGAGWTKEGAATAAATARSTAAGERSAAIRDKGAEQWDIRESDWVGESDGYDSDGTDFFSNTVATINEYTLHEIVGRGSFATVRLATRKAGGEAGAGSE